MAGIARRPEGQLPAPNAIGQDDSEIIQSFSNRPRVERRKDHGLLLLQLGNQRHFAPAQNGARREMGDPR